MPIDIRLTFEAVIPEILKLAMLLSGIIVLEMLKLIMLTSKILVSKIFVVLILLSAWKYIGNHFETLK